MATACIWVASAPRPIATALLLLVPPTEPALASEPIAISLPVFVLLREPIATELTPEAVAEAPNAKPLAASTLAFEPTAVAFDTSLATVAVLPIAVENCPSDFEP